MFCGLDGMLPLSTNFQKILHWKAKSRTIHSLFSSLARRHHHADFGARRQFQHGFDPFAVHPFHGTCVKPLRSHGQHKVRSGQSRAFVRPDTHVRPTDWFAWRWLEPSTCWKPQTLHPGKSALCVGNPRDFCEILISPLRHVASSIKFFQRPLVVPPPQIRSRNEDEQCGGR